MARMLDMRPPRIAMGLFMVSAALWHLSPDGTVLHFPYKLVGTACLLLGAAMNVWAWLLFRKAKTPVCATAEASALVREGAYRLTRNPMYLGMLLMLIGAAFFMGTIPSLFAPAAFFIIMDKVFVPYEEDKLQVAFGAGYSDYMIKTRRWI